MGAGPRGCAAAAVRSWFSLLAAAVLPAVLSRSRFRVVLSPARLWLAAAAGVPRASCGACKAVAPAQPKTTAATPPSWHVQWVLLAVAAWPVLPASLCTSPLPRVFLIIALGSSCYSFACAMQSAEHAVSMTSASNAPHPSAGTADAAAAGRLVGCLLGRRQAGTGLALHSAQLGRQHHPPHGLSSNAPSQCCSSSNLSRSLFLSFFTNTRAQQHPSQSLIQRLAVALYDDAIEIHELDGHQVCLREMGEQVRLDLSHRCILRPAGGQSVQPHLSAQQSGPRHVLVHEDWQRTVACVSWCPSNPTRLAVGCRFVLWMGGRVGNQNHFPLNNPPPPNPPRAQGLGFWFGRSLVTASPQRGENATTG